MIIEKKKDFIPAKLRKNEVIGITGPPINATKSITILAVNGFTKQNEKM
jgi:hypothetical protein